jgi:hypothetical protein
MSTSLSQTRQNRQQLLALAALTSAELVGAYGESYRRIRTQLDELTRQINASRLRGEMVNAAWLKQQHRLTLLLATVAAELHDFSVQAADRIERAQSVAVEMGQDHTLAVAGLALVIAAATGRGARQLEKPSPATLAQLVGNTIEGVPVADLLEPLAADAVARLSEITISLVVRERETTEIVSAAERALSRSLTSALTVGRTVTVDSYRESARQVYLANPQSITGWVWISELSETTCELCYAMHGTVHEPYESLDSHPNCLCQQMPLTAADADVTFETGAELFDKLPADEQESVLGPRGFELFKRGEIKLQDFVGTGARTPWGPRRYSRSLREIAERKRA